MDRMSIKKLHLDLVQLNEVHRPIPFENVLISLVSIFHLLRDERKERERERVCASYVKGEKREGGF